MNYKITLTDEDKSVELNLSTELIENCRKTGFDRIGVAFIKLANMLQEYKNTELADVEAKSTVLEGTMLEEFKKQEVVATEVEPVKEVVKTTKKVTTKKK